MGDTAKEAMALLTKDEISGEAQYFERIAGNKIATMVKLLDRCSNVSGMAAAFSKEKMAEYIRETEEFIYPLLEKAKREYPEYSDQIFLIRYHMMSVVESVKRLG